MDQKQLSQGITYDKLYQQNNQNIWFLACVLKQRRCNPDFNQQILSVPFTIQREYWSNGQLDCLSIYQNGQLHGLSREWDPKGQLQWERHRQNGQLHGLSRGWDENGQLRWEREWQNGKLIS